MEKVEYRLLHPAEITLKSADGERVEKIDTVSVREPKGKDMRALNHVKGELAQSLEMIELLTGLERYQVDEMHAADLAGIGEIIEGFMEPGRPTG